MGRTLIAAACLLALAAPARAQPEIETFADGLDFPTNMAFAPDGRLFFTEKNTGRVRVIDRGRLLPEPFTTVPSTSENETGLLGIALHPDFPDEPWVYLYYTSRETLRNELVRVRADGNRGGETEPVFEALAFSPWHDGGDLVFGPDGMLYVVLGEAHDPQRAQDPDDIGGKVLRLTPEGAVPPDNPREDSPVYTLGHRNSFGLCVDPFSGIVWETENGPDAHDEVNALAPGGNYGWPEVQGEAGDERFLDPALDFPQVIVPTGCAFYPHPHLGARNEGALFFGDFGGRLRRAEISHQRTFIVRSGVFLDGLGGITDVATGPDERLYVATTEAILRLPAEIPEPRPGPTATADPPAIERIEPVEPAPTGAPWWPWAVAAGVVTLLAGVSRVRRRR